MRFTVARLLVTAAVAFSMLPTGTAAAESGGASEDPINADRPGFAEGSSVVGKGRAQVEAGVQQEYRRDSGSRVRTLSVPTLLRFGVAEQAELRVEGNTYTRENEGSPGAAGQRSEGIAPTSLGMKLRLPDAGGSQGTAAIVRYFPRSGTGNFRSNHATGDFRLLGDWELAPNWSFNPNLGVGFYEDDAQRRYTTGLLAATLGYDVSKGINLFVDTALQLPEARSGGVGAILDVGATYLVGRDLQLDFSAGTRIAGTTFPRRFLSLGVSRRF
jgi:hypothetical protein